MITNIQVQELAENFGVADLIIEKDYFIELFIKQAFLSGLFGGEIVFRGGTALKKVYFEDYRFSEGMDFIVFEKNKLDESLKILKNTVDNINNAYPWDSKIRSEINNERLQVFISYDIVPEIKIKKEIKIDIIGEDINPSYRLRKIKFVHNEHKDIEARVNTYDLEAMVGDKITRIISVTKEARDIYDLWKLMGLDLNTARIKTEFRKRTGFDPEARTIVSNIKNEVFKKTWLSRLKAQVPGLAEYERVIAELEPLIMTKFT